MIIDTHIHLDDKRYEDDLDAVLARAREAGVKRFIIPGADPSTLEQAVAIAQKYEDVYFAIGVHPYDMDGFENLDFEKYIHHKKCVAVGECGLDYFRLEGSDEEKELEKKRQKEVFVAQIEIAKKYKKPLIIHIRDASRDSKELLMQNAAREV
ncbi:TatD family hydrolase, partial [bacterium]|nr:TatD family hydrolase [bacterium]